MSGTKTRKWSFYAGDLRVRFPPVNAILFAFLTCCCVEDSIMKSEQNLIIKIFIKETIALQNISLKHGVAEE